MVDTFTVFHLKDGYLVEKKDYINLDEAIANIKNFANGRDYTEGISLENNELYWCRVSDGNITHSFYIEKYLDETEYR